MKWITAGISFFCFLLLIILLSCVDVAAIGPAETSIGLAGFNQAFHNATGEIGSLYLITKLLGYAALLFAGLFALAGIIQWVRRKSLKKVDREILCLGGLYAVLLLIYVFFEKIVINYRPILEEGQTFPEASFPSSHTMLACVIFGSAMLVIHKYLSDPKAIITKVILCTLIMISVVGRLFCGVHWLTDIIGGVLISIALVAAFSAVLEVITENQK